MSLLQVQNLNVQFKTSKGVVDIIKNIHFTVEEGEVLGIVGESGSGKSVTSLAIMNLLADNASTNGEILFKKQKIIQSDYGQKISMIFQDPQGSLNPTLTVGDQLRDIIKAHQDLPERGLQQLMLETLKSVGIHEPELRLKQYAFELSGGMAQRVMIAMAIVNGPELLIADEPTTALDVTIQKQILNLLKNLQKKKKMSMILISHDMGLISAYSDRIVVMYKGQIREMGKTADVLAKPQDAYTQELLKCLPGHYLEEAKGFRLPTINYDRIKALPK